MALAKTPDPVEFEVFELAMVGFADVLQQTPRADTAPPPSLVILPPLEALIEVIVVKTVVVKVGKIAAVVAVN